MAILKNFRKSKSLELLGCSIEECRKYLESKFLPGMTWKNSGNGKNKWNIDHIIPCSAFDLSYYEQQKLCFHYTNLQPLWCEDNQKKGDKLIPQ